MFHICQTIWRHFSLRQVKLCIVQRNYKQKFMTDQLTDRLTDQASEFALAHLTPILHFCKIVVCRFLVHLPVFVVVVIFHGGYILHWMRCCCLFVQAWLSWLACWRVEDGGNIILCLFISLFSFTLGKLWTLNQPALSNQLDNCGEV